MAINELKVDHKPDFTNTEPAVSLGPFPQWSDPKKIVAMDPLGHLAPWLYKDYIGKEDVEIRPTIAITKAHMKLPELEQSMKEGRLKVDGKICLNESGELAVTKFAVEPVWYLPGVAERFGIGMCSIFYLATPFPMMTFPIPIIPGRPVHLMKLNPFPVTFHMAAYSPEIHHTLTAVISLVER